MIFLQILRTQVIQSDGQVLTAHCEHRGPVARIWWLVSVLLPGYQWRRHNARCWHQSQCLYSGSIISSSRGTSYSDPSDRSGYVPSDVIITAISAERSVMLRGYRRVIIIPRRSLSHAYSLTLKLKERSFHIICQCIVVFIPRLWCHSTHSRK